MQQRQSPFHSSNTQQPALPVQPASKPAPLPLGMDQLRQVSGGNSAPNKGW